MVAKVLTIGKKGSIVLHGLDQSLCWCAVSQIPEHEIASQVRLRQPPAARDSFTIA
jgi:hypothetical protein